MQAHWGLHGNGYWIHATRFGGWWLVVCHRYCWWRSLTIRIAWGYNFYSQWLIKCQVSFRLCICRFSCKSGNPAAYEIVGRTCSPQFAMPPFSIVQRIKATLSRWRQDQWVSSLFVWGRQWLGEKCLANKAINLLCSVWRLSNIE